MVNKAQIKLKFRWFFFYFSFFFYFFFAVGFKVFYIQRTVTSLSSCPESVLITG